MIESNAMFGVEKVIKAFDGTGVKVISSHIYEALLKSESIDDIRKNVTETIFSDNKLGD